jgi:hypothetical protein
LTIALEVVPVEVVWADHWAADAFAKIVVPDLSGVATICGRSAHACASFNIKIPLLITVVWTRIGFISWIALTAATGGTPVLVCIAVARVLAETLAMFGVKVIRCWAFVWFALAFAVIGVEIEVARAFLVSAETSA